MKRTWYWIVGAFAIFVLGCFVGANLPETRRTIDDRLVGSWVGISQPDLVLMFLDDGSYIELFKSEPSYGALKWHVDGDTVFLERVGEEGERQMEAQQFRVKDAKLTLRDGYKGCHDFEYVEHLKFEATH